MGHDFSNISNWDLPKIVWMNWFSIQRCGWPRMWQYCCKCTHVLGYTVYKRRGNLVHLPFGMWLEISRDNQWTWWQTDRFGHVLMCQQEEEKPASLGWLNKQYSGVKEAKRETISLYLLKATLEILVTPKLNGWTHRRNSKSFILTMAFFILLFH